jgi:lipopolysaccharide export system protein LptC
MPDAKRLALALLLLVLAGGSWWLARSLTAVKPAFDGHLRHDPDYTIDNFQATVMDETGWRQYTLTGTRLVHYGDDESLDIERPYLVKYTEDGPPVHTRAAHGWMPKDSDVIVMTGDVRVTRERSARSAGGVMRLDRMRVRLDK